MHALALEKWAILDINFVVAMTDYKSVIEISEIYSKYLNKTITNFKIVQVS